jgi:hypothetical protein
LREEKCFAAQILMERGVRVSQVREELARQPHEAAQGQKRPSVRAELSAYISDLVDYTQPLIGREKELIVSWSFCAGSVARILFWWESQESAREPSLADWLGTLRMAVFPMGAKQKFQLSIRSIIDPVSFLTVAGIAGAEQYKNFIPAYGGGIEGYGKRYGAALANHVSGTLLGKAVYPSIFHQDPRYFYKGKGSIRSRALYAISAAVIARGDDGRSKPNYSLVLGNFSAAAISNLYYPASDRGASLVVLNGLAGMGAGAVSNLIREFVLKGITSHVPKEAKGQP